MTDNVVTPAFGRKPEAEPEEPRIWVCVCGCKDFMLREDETTECALCGRLGDGHWTKNLTDSDEPPPSYIRTSVDHGTIDLAKKSLLRDVDDADTLLLVVGRRDGTLRAWKKSDELESPEQREWIRSMMQGATALMLDEKFETEEKP